MFLYGGVLKLIGDISGLVGPLSISYIVDYIGKINITNSNQDTSFNNNNYNNINISQQNPKINFIMNENSQIYYLGWFDFIENGWIMCFSVLIASLAQASFSQASTHIVNMVGIRLRTSIQGLIYRKTLLISSSCFFGGNGGNKIDNNDSCNIIESVGGKRPHEKLPEKQSVFDIGTITNLMSEDALNVMSFFAIAHYVWAIPLKVIIFFELIILFLSEIFTVILILFFNNCFADSYYHVSFIPATGYKCSYWCFGLRHCHGAITICYRLGNGKELEDNIGMCVFLNLKQKFS